MTKKSFLFTAILILLNLVVLEGLAGLGLLYLHHRKNIEYRPAMKDRLSDGQRAMIRKILDGKAEYISHSPELGWSILPNGEHDIYRANAQGLRADSDYTLTPGSKLRIAAFGMLFIAIFFMAQRWRIAKARLDREDAAPDLPPVPQPLEVDA